MCIISSMIINWQFRRIDHNDLHKPEPVMSPSSCTYDSHITKNERSLAYCMHILNSCVVQQVWNCQPSVSAIPAAYLLCSTAILWDIRAAWWFCSCELPFRSAVCGLLHCFNAQPYFCSCQLYWRSPEHVLLPCFDALPDNFADI